MHKLLFFLCGLFLLACNNQSSTAGNKDTTASATTTGANSPRFTEDELDFLGPCFDNAKATLGEQRAYTLCRCIYQQVQQKYPGADSTTLVQHMSDTAEVRQMTINCQ